MRNNIFVFLLIFGTGSISLAGGINTDNLSSLDFDNLEFVLSAKTKKNYVLKQNKAPLINPVASNIKQKELEIRYIPVYIPIKIPVYTPIRIPVYNPVYIPVYR